MENIKTTAIQNIFRIVLGLLMMSAGFAHFTFARQEFQAQVPDWVPLSKDLVVILSGVVELLFGAAMVFWSKQKFSVGFVLAVFYVLIFPGNIAQYTNGTDAFGLNTDRARLIRLFFQPILIFWALWSSGVLTYWLQRKHIKH